MNTTQEILKLKMEMNALRTAVASMNATFDSLEAYPTVEIVSVLDNNVTNETVFNLTYEAFIGVSAIELLRDGAVVGDDNSQVGSISQPLLDNDLSPGDYSYVVRITDAYGRQTLSEPYTTTIQAPILPSVSLTTPSSANETISGLYAFSATTFTNGGGAVTAVEIHVGNMVFAAETIVEIDPLNHTFSHQIDTNNIPDGSYTVFAVAHNLEGESETSASFLVSIDNVPAVDPGRISIVPGTQTYSGIVPIQFEFGEEVTFVNLFIDIGDGSGLQSVGTSSTSPFSINFDTTTILNGNYHLVARSFGVGTQMLGESDPLPIIINNPPVGAPHPLSVTATPYGPTTYNDAQSSHAGNAVVSQNISLQDMQTVYDQLFSTDPVGASAFLIHYSIQGITGLDPKHYPTALDQLINPSNWPTIFG